MQDQRKVEGIRCLLQNLTFHNEAYSDKKIGTHFSYDTVIELLKQADETMEGTARNPRPANLPKNIPWSEKFADPEEEFDPYSYDGSMSPEDYDTMIANFEADRAKSVVNDHTGEDSQIPQAVSEQENYKIKFYNVHGEYTSETQPFASHQLPEKMKAATTAVNTNPAFAGWEAFYYSRVRNVWNSYSPDGKTALYYETGRRGDHIAYSTIHDPAKSKLPPIMP